MLFQVFLTTRSGGQTLEALGVGREESLLPTLQMGIQAQREGRNLPKITQQVAAVGFKPRLLSPQPTLLPTSHRS